ncbi:hypothetical protein, partial [Candidatus Magnetaquicoccus inordinatus]|uniref:hypothetical protein n=1 Tax=Candidatus Magnetaquicoccus inordinatus TaxID=2496818 RepID=UPI001D0EF9B0
VFLTQKSRLCGRPFCEERLAKLKWWSERYAKRKILHHFAAAQQENGLTPSWLAKRQGILHLSGIKRIF